MSRTKPKDVKDLLETELSSAQISAWIQIAHTVIDRYAAICTTAPAATLKQLETLLTCHMITSSVEREKTATSTKMGSASESYMITGGANLDSSPYGQQMKMLDPCGRLHELFQRKAVTKVI